MSFFCKNKRGENKQYYYFNYYKPYSNNRYSNNYNQLDIKEKDFFDNYKNMLEYRRDFFNEKVKEEIKLNKHKKLEKIYRNNS